MSIVPTQAINKKITPAPAKLPKGEFPSNIHILKGAGAVDGADGRAATAGDKSSSK